MNNKENVILIASATKGYGKKSCNKPFESNETRSRKFTK